MVTVGGKHAIFKPDASANRSWRRGHHPAPNWVTYKDVVNFAGGTCVFVQTDEGKWLHVHGRDHCVRT